MKRDSEHQTGAEEHDDVVACNVVTRGALSRVNTEAVLFFDESVRRPCQTVNGNNHRLAKVGALPPVIIAEQPTDLVTPWRAGSEEKNLVFLVTPWPLGVCRQ